MFRGEFVGLTGGADFYADSVAGLAIEGAASLKTFLGVCKEKGIDPNRTFSGKFQVRLPEILHAQAAEAAAARGISLNQLVQNALEEAMSAVSSMIAAHCPGFATCGTALCG